MNQFLYFMDMEKGYRDLKILFREIKVEISIRVIFLVVWDKYENCN